MSEGTFDGIIIRLKLIDALIKANDINQAKIYVDILTDKYEMTDLVAFNQLIVTNNIENASLLIEQLITTYEKINRNFKSEGLKESTFNNEIKLVLKNPILFRFKKDGKWGFKDIENNIIIDNIYDDALNFNECKAAVKKENKWGFINQFGTVCSDFIFDKAESYSDGMAAVMSISEDYVLFQEKKSFLQKWGFINHESDLTVSFQYNEVRRYSEGLAMVTSIVNYSEGMQYFQKKYKYGFIDKLGNIIIEFKDYVSSNYWHQDWWRYHNNPFEFIDDRCKIFISSDKKPFNQDVIINKSGDIILSNLNYNIIESYSEGLSAVAMATESLDFEGNKFFKFKWGFVDINGNEIINCKFDNVGSFKEGLAPVCIDDKWGFINKSGSIIIGCKFRTVRQFSEGLAATYLEVINLNNNHETYKWGFIDVTGKTVIPHIYDGYSLSYEEFLPGIDSFKYGRVQVKKNDNWFMIDKQGELIN